jgi:hypothetical protein
VQSILQLRRLLICRMQALQELITLCLQSRNISLSNPQSCI